MRRGLSETTVIRTRRALSHPTRPPFPFSPVAGQGDDDERLMWTSEQALGLLSVDVFTTFQEIEGFGGAITDSAAINIHKLSPATRDVLMRFVKLKLTSAHLPVAGL